MSRKILVVDDEPLILKTIERALTKIGYEVGCTADLQSFIAALISYDPPPDMLIMDLNLGSINSDDFIDKIRELAPSSRILFISGAFPELFEDREFLEKPFRIDELRDKVKKMLGDE